MNTEKLELKHLAAYLPYKLKMQSRNGTDFIMGGLKVQQTFEGGVWDEDGYFYGRCKPYLRPLSQLTETITHNEETFVPIQRLNDMRGVALPHDQYDELYSEENCFGCKWAGVYSFWFDKETLSFYDNTNCGVSPQLEMFQKLHEWHFDLYSLLSSNLALPLKD